MPTSGKSGLVLVRCSKFQLAIFVQCNILGAMRAMHRKSFRQSIQKSGRIAGGRKEADNMIKLDDMQKLGKDNMDAAMKSFGAFTKAGQAIATEVVDYSKKSFEDGAKVVEKLLGAKSLDKAIEIQADYAKVSYESFIAQATKLGELYADLAKETYKPFETYAAKVAPAK